MHESLLEPCGVELTSFGQLRATGWSRRAIDRAVRHGVLVRPRRDCYLPGDAHSSIVAAVQAGARLDCVSLLALLGVFVLERRSGLHLQFTPGSAHLPPSSTAVLRHWRQSDAPGSGTTAPLVEALVQACRCQPPRAAIATLDSAWHLGLIDEGDIAVIFARLPRRFQILRRHLDPRSESGPETLMRLIARSLGCDVQLQVVVEGVGRVDMIVDGWLVIECDSRAHHAGWEAQVRDRARDLALAAQGYARLRPTAEMIIGHPEAVVAALRGMLDLGRLLAARAPGRNPGNGPTG